MNDLVCVQKLIQNSVKSVRNRSFDVSATLEEEE